MYDAVSENQIEICKYDAAIKPITLGCWNTHILTPVEPFALIDEPSHKNDSTTGKKERNQSIIQALYRFSL